MREGLLEVTNEELTNELLELDGTGTQLKRGKRKGNWKGRKRTSKKIHSEEFIRTFHRP